MPAVVGRDEVGEAYIAYKYIFQRISVEVKYQKRRARVHACGGFTNDFHFLYARTAVQGEVVGGEVLFESAPASSVHREI